MHERAINYRLVDFGFGRKLESFGGVLVDRPCPAARDATPSLPAVLWKEADLFFRKGNGTSWFGSVSSSAWIFDHPSVRLHLRCTAAGQVGVFPEQLPNWEWIAEFGRPFAERRPHPLKCLNLFAYTGATTLVLARLQAEVVHLDASVPAIDWAKQNAILSGLGDARIRWIQDDVRRFMKREVRRGSKYDIIVLDPPSYGHGKRGEPWVFEEHMEELLSHCVQILSDQPLLLLWTGHSESPNLQRWVSGLSDQLRDRLRCPLGIRRSLLFDQSSRPLDCGFSVRWQR